jgi:hypothetical protein
LTDDVGAVVVNVPAAQVECGLQETEATLFCAWYVEPVHPLQMVDAVSYAKPAEQYLQLVPLKVVNV